ncbi:glycoside hydrolase family 15 protein [Actinomycetes bacterium KLBMP 9797]
MVSPLNSTTADHTADTWRYAPIAEHGLIGNLRTAALVSTDATIDWYCPGRFDAPSVFAALLDRDRGGMFRIAPVHPGWTTRQLYLPDSAVLVTRFLSEEGVAEVVDFMPVTGRVTDAPDVLVRLVRVVRGEVRMEVRCAPRFDYGRGGHTLVHEGDAAVFHAAGCTLRLDSDRKLKPEGDDVVAILDLAVGETAWFALGGGVRGDDLPRRVGSSEVHGRYRSTLDFWHRWVGASTYRGRWRETVTRSAITLKLLTYEPTGAIVAAPTAGLPEQIGGERNWDYRYVWIRDASFTVHALIRLGYLDEARRLFRWLTARPGGTGGADGGPLQLMYQVDGSSDLHEYTLDHLEGYRSSRPVRVGNGAATQLQLDIYGELLDAIWTAYRRGGRISTSGWARLRQLADWVAMHWDQPDEGIWETRGGRKNFIHGRVMSWVALDRMIRLAGALGWPAETAGWTEARDAIHTQVMTKGWHTGRRAFVQAYGTEVLDAALLVMPIVGFVSDTEPAWQSTLSAIGEALVSDSLVYRYDPAASPDGLRGHEGTFSMCTFWYVETLARAGRIADARLIFEKMLTYGNHLGLYAEELGPNGEQLGNFPQAFTHLALINAATTLDAALDTPADRRPADLA